MCFHKSFKYRARAQNIPVKIDKNIARNKTAIRPIHIPDLIVNSKANEIQYSPTNNCPKLYEQPTKKTLKILKLLL